MPRFVGGRAPVVVVDGVVELVGSGGAVVIVVGCIGVVATIVLAGFCPVEYTIAAEAPPAAIARPRRAGQIQSPGYHGSRRRQAPPNLATIPCWTGSRRPHWRQYS